jgi:insulysin
VLEKCTPEDVTAFLPLMLAQLHVEVLVHGNMSAEEALKVAALARSTLLVTLVCDWPPTCDACL